MDTTRQSEADFKGGPLPGLLRPPIVFLVAILLGIALNLIWPLPFTRSTLRLFGPLIVVCAILLFLLSLREFRAAGTSVRGSVRTTAIVRTGPYRFSRNPIYLSFILLVSGWSVWLNDLWLIIMLVPAVGVIRGGRDSARRAISGAQLPWRLSTYRATVRRWF